MENLAVYIFDNIWLGKPEALIKAIISFLFAFFSFHIIVLKTTVTLIILFLKNPFLKKKFISKILKIYMQIFYFFGSNFKQNMSLLTKSFIIR